MIFSEREIEERFNEFLDECYGQVKIGPYEYSCGDALQRTDPTAFRQCFIDWLDSELGETLWELPNGDYTDEDPDSIEERA